MQSVRKGAPGICGSVGSVPDLRTMDHLGGPIERAMLNAAVSQVAQYFKMPLYSTAGTSDAKEMDIQAAYESAMSSLLVAMSGANYIHDIAGLMEADLTVSYEKLVIDNEILGMCQRVLRGIEVSDETLAVDLMIEKGPGQNYFTEEHTIRHMRQEFFTPRLANRKKRGQPGGDQSALTRARKVVADVRAEEPVRCLEADLRRKILDAFPENNGRPKSPLKARRCAGLRCSWWRAASRGSSFRRPPPHPFDPSAGQEYARREHPDRAGRYKRRSIAPQIHKAADQRLRDRAHQRSGGTGNAVEHSDVLRRGDLSNHGVEIRRPRLMSQQGDTDHRESRVGTRHKVSQSAHHSE